MRMAKEDPVVITYTDRQAVEDGVLVPFPGEGGVNRITRAVFDHFTRHMGSSPITGPVVDITALSEVIREMLALSPDEDGWRTGAHRGKKLWLVPNEVGGLTLMFPDDY